jgi:hypothetical protein
MVFLDRTRGKTKLNALTLVETLVMALKFKRLYRKPSAGCRPADG